jgi:glycosyltransferase involved in cell wall biosynthesis
VRVLHVIQPPRGGAVTAMLLLVRHQIERHEVGVVCHSAGNAGVEARALGARVWTLPVDRSVRLREDAGHLRRLHASVRDFRPDVVHAHSSKAGVLARLASRAQGIPVVYSPQNFAYRSYEGRLSSRALFFGIERALAPLTSCLHVVSNDEYEDAVGRGMAPSNRCGTIHNGIDINPLLDIAPPSSGKRVTIGTFARLFAQKRIDVFLDALRAIRQRGLDFDAVVIGDGPERSSLIEHARAIGLDRDVTFDSTPHDAVAALHRIDVFALTSSHDACPLAVMEAMAGARPVIATDVGAVSQIITTGESGLVVPQGDVEALADAMEQLIVSAPLRESLALAARAKAKRRFGSELMAGRMEALYETALNASA